MQSIYPHSAGLDVHKRSVVGAHIQGYADNGDEIYEAKTFGTMTRNLLEMADWLIERGITHIAMESTGEYWKPVYNILEGQFTLFVVNAYHVKHVPGRKTDVNDAEWLAKLMTHGLLAASFVPPPGQRELRELTRARTGMVRERTNLINRLHKTLESTNIKLTSVVSDIRGVSAQAMLAALVAGETNTTRLADLARGRLHAKREDLEQALEGRFKATHRFIITELLTQIEGVECSIARFDSEIERMCVPFEVAVSHADTVPGIGLKAARAIISEIGSDLANFPTAGHLCAWAGVAPSNNQSAGKTVSRRTRHGNAHLKRLLVEVAHAAVKVKDSYLAAQYHRLAGRRGKRRAIMAVAHTILRALYHMLKDDKDYYELGGNYFDARQPVRATQNLVSRLTQMGYNVQLSPKIPSVVMSGICVGNPVT
jgi:transposase